VIVRIERLLKHEQSEIAAVYRPGAFALKALTPIVYELYERSSESVLGFQVMKRFAYLQTLFWTVLRVVAGFVIFDHSHNNICMTQVQQ
jgi:hypothetical protein